MINGNQFTIVWYVDTNKLLYEDPTMIIDILKQFRAHLGDIVITRGKKYTFLGMNITIRDDNNIDIKMKDQLLKAINIISDKIIVQCGFIT